MRQFLAMAFLGATLAFSASAALADEKVDYIPPSQRTQGVSVVSRPVIPTGPGESAVAGSITATSVYRQLREENKEH